MRAVIRYGMSLLLLVVLLSPLWIGLLFFWL